MSTRPRVNRSRFQTPARSYLHPGTGRRITVVTTCHLGEPGYYQQLHATITGYTRDGAVVHSEGSDQVNEPAHGDLTPTEKDAIAERRHVHDLTVSLVADLGWTDQKTSLADPGWQYIDLPTIEIIRRIGTDKMLRRFRTQSALLSRAAYHPPTTHLARIGIAVSLRRTTHQKARPHPDGHPDAVLVDQRNRIALDAAHATDRDLVLLWGAGHLHGFDTDLTSRGYLLHHERWHTALTLPSVTTALTRLLLRRPPTTTHPQPTPTGDAVPPSRTPQ